MRLLNLVEHLADKLDIRGVGAHGEGAAMPGVPGEHARLPSDAVGIGADIARGAAYSADGFSCKGAREGAGSEWAKAWTGTYYAYDCKTGAEQVAFNWGANYSY